MHTFRYRGRSVTQSQCVVDADARHVDESDVRSMQRGRERERERESVCVCVCSLPMQ
jgi:hypothetical protein